MNSKTLIAFRKLRSGTYLIRLKCYVYNRGRNESEMGKLELNKKKKKDALFNTAFELFTTKGLTKTTIADIVDQAGVAKGTFYLYFKDKYDLIKWIYLNEVILKIENDDDWTEKYKEIFKYFIENRQMVLNIYNCEA